MVSGFERSTAVRIPKNDVKTYHDFVSRDPAFENSDKSLAVVVHKSNKSKGAADGEAMDVDVDVEEEEEDEEDEDDAGREWGWRRDFRPCKPDA